jgi:peroxiredoxin
MAWGRQRELLKTGSSAPSFKLKDLDGKERTLEDLLASGPVMLAFYKASCPVCQFTLPYLERLSKGGTPFAAVSQDDAPTARSFNREYSIGFTTLLDASSGGYAASNAFGISTVPSCFLVEKDGVISWSMEGWSKGGVEELAQRAGVAAFKPGEYVPEWKAG